MHARIWTPVSIILILFSFIAFAFLAQRPLCIDSRVVERIDRVDASGKIATVFRCGMYRAVPYDEEFNNSLTSLSRRVQGVEKFLESLASFGRPVHISIIEDKENNFQVLEQEIFISRNLLAYEGALERALIKAWLNQKARAQLLDHPLLSESLNDLLLFASKGEFLSIDPVLKLPLDLMSLEKWPFVVKSLGRYCRSPWRQYEHLAFCARGGGQADPKERSLIPLSVRPLLSQSMIAAYMELAPGERKNFLEYLPRILGEFRLQAGGGGFSSLEADRQSLVDLSFELSSLRDSLAQVVKSQQVGSANEDAYRRWNSLFAGEIQKRGFADQAGPAQLDSLIVLHNVKVDTEIPSLTKAIDKNRELLSALVDGDQVYLLPSAEALSRRLFGQFVAKRVTLVTCGTLTLAEVDAFADMSPRLTLVEHCQDSSLPEINYEGLVSGDLEKFARQNQRIGFVEIHLPSLRYAIQANRLNSSVRLSSNLENQKLRQALGWQDSSYDQRLKSYHTKSAIEAFQLYRPGPTIVN